MNIYAVLSILFWSTVASVFKLTLSRIDPVSMLLYSSITSTLVFLLVNMIRKPGNWSSIRANYNSILLGFVNPFFYYLVLFTAYSRLPAQEAQALNYTWPIMLVLFSSYLLRQPVTLNEVFGVLLGFLGIVIIGTRGDISSLSFKDPVGDGLALSSAMLFAMYWILNLQDDRRAEVKMFWNFLFGSVYISLYAIGLGGVKLDPLGILGAVYIGIFEMGVTYLLWLKALETDRAGKVASLIYLTPVISLGIISLTVGEKIMASTVVGLGLILSGVFLSRRGGGPAGI
ncbi:hypothetical protein PNA2_0077 [Pyrococcus sp. NA2]|uniref:DMT family transporter n=1 Tax=Pyrococcus sp. (strain NA2) TaxID=342949 RepID=UPI000209ADB6|nr:DMT family transporter [Pyrococcus sp. NA2]AEC50995.1 hypothetical protein PNA2_0077 [Pyrococcus sp. NA2]